MEHLQNLDIEKYKETDIYGDYRASLFFLTINTNQNFNTRVGAANRVVSNAFMKMIKQNRNGRVYKIKKGDKPEWLKWYGDDETGMEQILSIKVIFATEVGSIQNRLHIHAWIDVRHNGRYQIDTNYIANNFFHYATGINFQGKPFVHVAHVKVNSKENIIRYMMKDVYSNTRSKVSVERTDKDMSYYVGEDAYNSQVKDRLEEIRFRDLF